MKKSILFFGNCQVDVICKTLNLNSNDYEQITIKGYEDNVTHEYMSELLKTMDIVITQPIKDDYLNKPYLSTSYIINNCKPDCKIIIIPSYHFKFYYFDVSPHEKLGQRVSAYHYDSMIECYKQGQSVDYYIDNYVDNPLLKNKEELEKIADDCIKELENRYNDSQKYKINTNVITLPISQFIRDNYKRTLLFHTTNHPTNILFHHVCHEILNVLHMENTIDYWSDHLSSIIRNIMYKCVEQVVEFNRPAPLIDYHNRAYHHDAKSITEFFYNGYDQLDKSYFN